MLTEAQTREEEDRGNPDRAWKGWLYLGGWVVSLDIEALWITEMIRLVPARWAWV